ncbi:GNAT family N-acetyltransferase [Actinoplanes missouriensis]|uniref:GNAT family N-acetyltransferase n=1 Tax=Actinoplanes missouriensis TaxID=1866 RepID=UPI0002FA8FF3|nr:GNAT family N-acetyltransferase [Actinoplanes missouriensis]
MELTTWYLEQTDAAQIQPGREPRVPVEVGRAEVASPELSRFLYTAVGGDWFWTDRLSWTWAQWQDWLTRPGVETWVASVRGTPAGYVELDGRHPGAVEIAYFGLLPQFAGLGLGGHLLTEGLRRAWRLADRWPHQTPISRVWVHTCSLDGPAALANYRARGLTAYRTEVTPSSRPAETPGPWPGAGPRVTPGLTGRPES